MSVKSTFENFVGFITHYGNELAGIVTTIKTITNSLPIDIHDKTNINNILDDLSESVSNIHNAIANMGNPQDVVIKKSDLIEAVAEYLNSDEGKHLLGTDVVMGNNNG